MIYPPLGVQTGIFGGHYDAATQTDLILDSIADAGYTAFEDGVGDAARFGRKMAERGLTYAGAHLTLPGLQDIPALVRFLGTVECHDVCNSGLLTWDNPGPEDFRQGAAALNTAGYALRAEGIFLHYHNHAFEFQTLADGQTGMEILLAALDPAVVDLCVDVAWVQKGGADPAAFLPQNAANIGYLHLKDYQSSLTGDGWTELGRGEVNLAAVMAVIPTLPHVRWAVVEQDSTPGDPCESIVVSRRCLQSTFGY